MKAHKAQRCAFLARLPAGGMGGKAQLAQLAQTDFFLNLGELKNDRI